MNTFNTKAIAAALLATLIASAAYAAPRSGHEQKSPEAKLATVPGLTDAQRNNITRIEKENRDARHALMKKMHDERQKLRDESTRKLRAALGDKAYADYLTWKMEQRRERHGDRGSHRSGGHRNGHGAQTRGNKQKVEEVGSDNGE